MFSSHPGEPYGQNCHSKMMSNEGMTSFMPTLPVGLGFEEHCADEWHAAKCNSGLRVTTTTDCRVGAP